MWRSRGSERNLSLVSKFVVRLADDDDGGTAWGRESVKAGDIKFPCTPELKDRCRRGVTSGKQVHKEGRGGVSTGIWNTK